MIDAGARLHAEVNLSENTADGVAAEFQEVGFFRPPRVPLIEAGYHIRMGRRGVRPSLIAKDSLIIHQPA